MRRDAGFTLVEMLVALGLLALISVAALRLIDALLSVERRTEGRLERLAELDRALYLIEADLTQAMEAPRRLGPYVGFRRHTPDGPMLVGYGTLGNTLVRLHGSAPRPAITGVTSSDWRFHRSTGWSAEGGRDDDPDPPDAVAITVTLSGEPGGTVRRVVPLPATR